MAALKYCVLILALICAMGAAGEARPTAEEALREAIQAARQARDAAKAQQDSSQALDRLVTALERLSESQGEEGVKADRERLEQDVEQLQRMTGGATERLRALKETYDAQIRADAEVIRKLTARVDALEWQAQQGTRSRGQTTQAADQGTRRSSASTESGRRRAAPVEIALYKNEFGGSQREILSVVNTMEKCIRDWRGIIHYSIVGQKRRFANMNVGLQGVLPPRVPVMVRKGEYGEEQGVHDTFAYKDARAKSAATAVYDVELETTGGRYVEC